MEYCFSKTLLNHNFQEVVEKAKDALQNEGFGIISEIDLDETFQEKLNISFKKYKILGACNLRYAYKAIEAEDDIGVFLPCNVVVTETNRHQTVKVSIVNPDAAMVSVDNLKIGDLADEITSKLEWVLKSIK